MSGQHICHCLWTALSILHFICCARGQVALSDWRTGIATNYGGKQDGLVSPLHFILTGMAQTILWLVHFSCECHKAIRMLIVGRNSMRLMAW